MTTDPDTATEHRPPGGRAWARPAALVVSCLIIGFVGGWVLRGDDGPTTVLEARTPASGSGSGAAAGTTTQGTATAPPSGTTQAEPPAAPPDRADVGLAVLNGTDTAGLAGDTASQAESFGYEGVTAGNAPPGTTGPSVVYFREGQRPAAERVATDLEFDQVRQLPSTGPLSEAVPETAQVVVVLGSG
jgi:hypothetical protein